MSRRVTAEARRLLLMLERISKRRRCVPRDPAPFWPRNRAERRRGARWDLERRAALLGLPVSAGETNASLEARIAAHA